MYLKTIAFAALAASTALVPATASAEAHREAATSPTAAREAGIARLVEVWGFIKYHHADAREGRIAMDQEFFALYPRIRAAGSLAEADALLAGWVAGLGRGEACDPCARDSEEREVAIASPTPDWLEGLPADLAGPLRAIYDNRSAVPVNFQISANRGAGNPAFANESNYHDTGRLDEEAMHMLFLARQWNVLRYWFPYRDIMDRSPQEILPESVADFLASDSELERKRARLRLGAHSNDSHVGIGAYEAAASPAFECVLPYSMSFVEGRLVVDGISMPESGPLQRGDVITRMGDRDISDMMREYTPLTAHSNQAYLERRMAGRFSRGECGTHDFAIERGGKAMTIPVERTDAREIRFNAYPSKERRGEVIQTLAGGVTYAGVPRLKLTHVDELIERANAGTGLILDIRGYRDDFTVFAVGGALVDEETPFVTFTMPDYATPGRFTWGATLPLTPDQQGRRITVPVVLLVDAGAISSSEYHAMGWRAGGATVIGSTTAGADGNASQLPLPDGSSMNFTGLGVFYPDRSPTQRIGIVPDIEVRPTIAGIAQGRDEVLDAALDHLAALP